jgi:hypothetical protein
MLWLESSEWLGKIETTDDTEGGTANCVEWRSRGGGTRRRAGVGGASGPKRLMTTALQDAVALFPGG